MRSSPVRYVGAVLTASLIVAGGAPSATATIPAVKMSVAGKTVRGSPYSHHVTTDFGDSCVEEFSDGFFVRVRQHVTVPAGSRQAILNVGPVEPVDYSVEVYRRLDRYGNVSGPSRTKQPSLLPPQGDRSEWGLQFPLKLTRNRYVTSYVEWPDDNCGGDTESADFVFPGLKPR